MGKQLERIVRRELNDAREMLSGADTGEEQIHHARTSVKKARAVLRLLRTPLGPVYTEYNHQLRTASRALSSLRDAGAIVVTLDRLRARQSAVDDGRAFDSVLRGLRERNTRQVSQASRVVAGASKALLAPSRNLPQEVGAVADFRSARAGAVRGYRAARRAARDLVPDSAASEFHEWRKRIKDHWYHVRLFAGLDDGSRSRITALARLERLLGDDHDLSTIRALLIEGDDRLGTVHERTLVIGSIFETELSLRRRSLTLSRKTLTERPGEFGRSVSAWWHGN